MTSTFGMVVGSVLLGIVGSFVLYLPVTLIKIIFDAFVDIGPSEYQKDYMTSYSNIADGAKAHGAAAQEFYKRKTQTQQKAAGTGNALAHDLKKYVDQWGDEKKRMKKKYLIYKDIVGEKFINDDFMYFKIMSVGEKLHKTFLKNIESIKFNLKVANNIDLDYINSRRKTIEENINAGKGTESDRRELNSLKIRENLRKEQLIKLNNILNRNEEIMRLFEIKIAKIGEVRVAKRNEIDRLENELNNMTNKRSDGFNKVENFAKVDGYSRVL